MVQRPAKNFIESRIGMKGVVINVDFTQIFEERYSELEEIVQDGADSVFGEGMGEVTKSTFTQNFDKGREVVRVSYDVNMGTIYKEQLDEFDSLMDSTILSTDLPVSYIDMSISSKEWR